jgi:hypothetical protein
MLGSIVLQAIAAVVTMSLVLEMGSAIAGASPKPGQSQVAPTRTGKERLGGKWSDEQRTDNCNVPPDRRGPKPRPDRCVEDSGMEAGRSPER